MTRPVIHGIWGLALGHLLLACGAGCDVTPPPMLRVGIFTGPGYEPLHVAKRLGYLGAGTTLRLVEYSSATQTLRAFRNGSIEAATLTLDEALLLAEDVPQIRVVLVMGGSHGADSVLGRPGFERVSDLRGHRVGFEAAAQGAYVLARMLDQGGLHFHEVTVVPIQVDSHEKAFTNGWIDAVVTSEPVRSRLLASGAKELFSSAQLPGEVIAVLVIRQGYAEQHPEQLDMLLRGWFKALEYQKENPDDSSRWLSERLRLTPEQTREAYRLIALPDLAENRCWFGGKASTLRTATERLGARMVQYQLLERPPNLESLFDPRPLERALPVTTH